LLKSVNGPTFFKEVSLKKVLVFFIALLFPWLLFAAPSSHQFRTFGPTVACDDLWQIALQVRPNKHITPQQAMIALLKFNPRAFCRHNINGLKQGYSLRIPSLNSMRLILPRFANHQVIQQNNLWKKIKRKMLSNPTQHYYYLRKLVCSPYHVRYMTKRFYSFSASPTSDAAACLKEKIVTLKQNNQALIAKTTQLLTQQHILEKTNAKQKQDIEHLHRQLAIKSQQFMQETKPLFATMSKMVNQLSSEALVLQNKEWASYPKMIAAEIKTPSLPLYLWVNRIIHVPYFQPLLLIWGVLILGLLALLYLSLRRRKQLRKSSLRQETKQSKHDKASNYSSIAGEDIITTKLDLARAYVDMGDYVNAREILKSVIKTGNKPQQKEARALLKKV